MSNPISSAPESAAGRSTAVKRTHHGHHYNESLIPGLPDDIAQLCLSLVPPSILYSVCRSWRSLIYSPSFPAFLSIYCVVLPDGQNQPDAFPDRVEFCSFDPISRRWSFLPPPPSDPPPRFLFRHPSFICRTIPIQSVAAAGRLAVIAATDDNFLPSLSHPLVFDPLTGKWTRGPRFAAPRRWCAAGASGRSLYVASGIGASYNVGVARTTERWDLDLDPAASRRNIGDWRRPEWRRLADLKDGKFSRDAIELIGWRGRLCMVNVKGAAAKEGVIYNIAGDFWREMPVGMLAGWRGPAAAMDEETIYAVDEIRGMLRRYNESRDRWEDVAGNGLFRGAQQVAAGGGRVCVLSPDGVKIVVVDVTSAKMWVEDVPPGIEAVGIQILPRMAR